MRNLHKSIDVFPMVVHPLCSSTAVRLVTGVAESATPGITPVPSVNSVDSVALCRRCDNLISDHKSRHKCDSKSLFAQGKHNSKPSTNPSLPVAGCGNIKA